MSYATSTAETSRSRLGAAGDHLDRILFGACAIVWLAALGTGVAATVALVELGRTPAPASGGSGTPWALYTVIGVSAVIIVGAVPLLLRARRSAQDEPSLTVARPQAPAPGAVDPATEKLRVAGLTATAVPSRLDPGYPAAAVDQLCLRFALVVAIAMGVAMVAIGVATYLMAVDSDVASWVLYGVAAVITLALPVAPWWFLRRLRELLDAS
ncbi:DUF2561 family protein [Mycobacterium sp. PS03-16]|uniref:DUF2561 family protein n=1 Tax=Mycobacterium sp. PS03-16 TaxID=2559611 RepID=UPI001074195F|nr:DUF2561 family protein [Mycobacterium sp. PS03-16]TFV60576.1 DUF2561 family protein [Mycobacterium sp. PS03-16]